MLRLLRILFGFIVAALVAGVTIVAFVVTPADVASLPAEAQSERLSSAGMLALLAATHSAIFAAPFALVAVGIGEMAPLRSWLYYVFVAVGISLGGLAAIHLNEVPGQPSILNSYALAAFVTVGVSSGLAYWLLAGRCAGERRADISSPPPAAPQTTGEPAAQAT